MNLSNSAIPAFAVVGYKKTGKTTLVSRLVTEFKGRGYRVATLKHDAHEFTMDMAGTDTCKHREAGADVVAIADGGKWAVQGWESEPPSLTDMLARIQGVDMILVEGYKQEPLPKIVIADQQGAIFQEQSLSNMIAIAVPVADIQTLVTPEVPVYDRNEVQALADLIESLLD